VAIAGEQPLDRHVEVACAARQVGGVVEVVDHFGHDLVDPRLAQRPRLRQHRAAVRHDVRAAGAAVDRADVGSRLLVEAPERDRGDRAGGGLDGAAPVLGTDACVRGLPVEGGLDAEIGRRRHDHLADRRRVIQDVAELGPKLRHVELLGTCQRVLLGDGEEQLDPDGRPLDRDPVGDREHHRDRRLVVRA